MPPWGDSVTLTPPPGNLTTPYAGYPGQPLPQAVSANGQQRVFPHLRDFLFVLPPNLQQAYSQNWNLSVQKQFLKDWAFTATYLGTRVLHNSYGNEQNPAVYYPGVSTGRPGLRRALAGAEGWHKLLHDRNTNARRVLTGINATQGAYFTQVTQAYTGMGQTLTACWSRCSIASPILHAAQNTPIRTASPVLQKTEIMPETNFRIRLTPTAITATAALTCDIIS